MRYSSEVRWILPGSAPSDVLDWFDRQGSVVKQPPRTDFYADLGDCATAGIKLRGDRLEFKALCPPVPTLMSIGPVAGEQSQWVKWSCSPTWPEQAGSPDTQCDWLAVYKSRSLRRYAFDASGTGPRIVERDIADGDLACEVELTSMRILRVGTVVEQPRDALWEGAPRWWTLAFEAFGSPTRTVDCLRRAAAEQLHKPPPIHLGHEQSNAYPKWLAQNGFSGRSGRDL